MFIPRERWHHHVGNPVLVHTYTGRYCGYLHGITGSYLHINGHRLVADNAMSDRELRTLADSCAGTTDLVFYGGAGLAIPLLAVAGITAIGLGAMSYGW